MSRKWAGRENYLKTAPRGNTPRAWVQAELRAAGRAAGSSPSHARCRPKIGRRNRGTVNTCCRCSTPDLAPEKISLAERLNFGQEERKSCQACTLRPLT